MRHTNTSDMGRVSTSITQKSYYQYDQYLQREMLFYWLRNKPDAHLLCSDNRYNYYSILVNGYDILFAKNKFRSDGVRMFLLNDNLAKCLGFINYADMRVRTPQLQHSRKMLSANAIQKAFW